MPHVKYSARNYRSRGGGGGERPSRNRLTVQIYYDILRAVDVLARGDKKATMYRVGRLASLPHGRLKARLDELRELGFLDHGLGVTSIGHEFCEDYAEKIVPLFKKYGLSPPD